MSPSHWDGMPLSANAALWGLLAHFPKLYAAPARRHKLTCVQAPSMVNCATRSYWAMPLANSEGICKDEERIFMADKIKLEFETRTVVGKKVNRLRRAGVLPATVYGK